MEKKTIRMADGSRSDTINRYQEGRVDVTVSVPIEKFQAAYDAFGSKVFEPSVVEVDGRSEDDLRVACAVLETVLDDIPMLTSGHVALLLATGCRSTIRAEFEREFGLATSQAKVA